MTNKKNNFDYSNLGLKLVNQMDQLTFDRIGKKSIETRWLKGYGSERRQLQGIDSLYQELEKRAYNPFIFASGDHNLKEQISAHYRSKTLIGIRGADLFNMFWMPSNSTVIMQASSGLINKAAQPILARCCGHQFYEIPHHGEKSPRLNFETIKFGIATINIIKLIITLYQNLLF